MKKKLIAVLLALLCLSAVACKPKDDAKSGKEYIFQYGNVDIKVGGKAAPVLEALKGKEPTVSSKASCLSGEDGEDVTYVYGGFRIETFRLKEGDADEQIRRVVFLDDSVVTKEGVTVGATVQKVKDTYGTPSDETAYRIDYNGKGMCLRFTLRDGTVTGVSYEVAE